MISCKPTTTTMLQESTRKNGRTISVLAVVVRLVRVDFVYMDFSSLKLETTFSHTTCCVVLKLEMTSFSY